MISYSITARASTPVSSRSTKAKVRISQAKAEGSQPASKDAALVGSVVLHFFATPQYADLGAWDFVSPMNQ